MTRLWTIGYERLPEMLIAELRAAGVRRVIDLRFRPQSRRLGMSETRLAALLCLEADPAGCHRRVVAEAVARRRRDLAVIDL